jgi:hypothetical protein
MKNQNVAIFYGVIAVGIIALFVGLYYVAFEHPFHYLRAYGALGAGALLIIVGIVGMVMNRPKAVAK